MTPDEMKALTEQAWKVKEILDPDGLSDVIGPASLQFLDIESTAVVLGFLGDCIDFLTGPARLEWAKVVKDGRKLEELGGVLSLGRLVFDRPLVDQSKAIADSISSSLTDLAAILTAGLEGAT